jgi:hypothetical protein
MRAMLVALASIVIFIGPPAAFAERDHLVGMVVNDLDDVRPGPGFTLETVEGTQTCELGTAKFRLLQAERDGADDPSGGPAGEFICYRARCGGLFSENVTSADQFGPHALHAKRTQLVCTPVDRSVCGDGDIDPGEACDGAALGSCTTWCLDSCTCAPDCTATTGGFCWFLGARGENCDDTCAAAGRYYDEATASYVGSDGSDANCQAVLTALGAPGTFSEIPCLYGYGCLYVAPNDLRCVTPATTSDAGDGDAQRACACTGVNPGN